MSICRGGKWRGDRWSRERVLTQPGTKLGPSPLKIPVLFLTQKQDSILTGLCRVAENRGICLRVPKEKVPFLLLSPCWQPGSSGPDLREILCCCWCQPGKAEFSVMRAGAAAGGGGGTHTSHHKANKPTGRAL